MEGRRGWLGGRLTVHDVRQVNVLHPGHLDLAQASDVRAIAELDRVTNDLVEADDARENEIAPAPAVDEPSAGRSACRRPLLGRGRGGERDEDGRVDELERLGGRRRSAARRRRRVGRVPGLGLGLGREGEQRVEDGQGAERVTDELNRPGALRARAEDLSEEWTGLASLVDRPHPRVVERGPGPAVDGQWKGDGSEVSVEDGPLEDLGRRLVENLGRDKLVDWWPTGGFRSLSWSAICRLPKAPR